MPFSLPSDGDLYAYLRLGASKLIPCIGPNTSTLTAAGVVGISPFSLCLPLSLTADTPELGADDRNTLPRRH